MPTILVVDDNRPSRELIVDILRPLSLHFVEAADGAAALAAASAAPPDLVILDLSMPDMDGYAVLERLRRDPRSAAAPVLAVTANAMPEDLARARLAGFTGVLTKPVRALELRRRVAALLESSHA